MMKFRVVLFATLFALIGLQAPVVIARDQPEELPIVGKVSDFELLDSRKQSFASEQLHGKVWIANFFFTSCGGVCPVMNGHVAALHKKLKEHEDFRIVSVTVDPMRDGPTALSRYADKFHADTSKWHFLTGSNDDVFSVIEKSFQLKEEGLPSSHTDKVLLVDGKFQIRGAYSGVEAEGVQQLEQDLKQLLKEGSLG